MLKERESIINFVTKQRELVAKKKAKVREMEASLAKEEHTIIEAVNTTA